MVITKRIEELEKAKFCFGICSNCKDGKHVIFIDFDNVAYAHVIADLLDIQYKHDISTFYILKTKSGYNAFSLSKRHLNEIQDILREYPSIDQHYVNLAVQRNSFALRMGGEKTFDGIVENVNKDEISKAHYLFFTAVMHYKLLTYGNFDDSLKFRIKCYRSVKHGYADMDLLKCSFVELKG